jgi:long-chain acyl-CoA synthetase
MARDLSASAELVVFQRHPAAQIQGGAAAVAALQAATSGQGAPFRIGGAGPVTERRGMFETLTGGSLGTPRRILRSQASWLTSFAVNARLFGIGPGVRVAVLGDLSHSLALYGAVEALCLGADLGLLDQLRPDHQRRALAAQAVALVYATPTQLRLMVETAGPVCTALRHVVIGGAKLDGDLRAALAHLAPMARITEFYGAAETSFITLSDLQSGAETVGHAYPGVSLQLRAADGAVVPDGSEGEVWVQSPYLFAGYAGDDPGSARWQDGWLCVGEIGVMTPQGLVLRGRAGRMVTVAGCNVFPEEIEAWLLGLPGVARAAVLPRPDALRGTVLVAALQGDAAQEGAILAAARARLGPLIAPRALFWQQDWPSLPSGKTDLAAMQRRVGPWP